MSKRKSSTKATGKAAPERPTMTIKRPAGARKGDRLIVYRVNSGIELADEGIKRGDDLVCLEDGDPRSGDLAMVECSDGATAGLYYPAPGGYVRLENGEGVEIFKPREVLTVARVVGVLRDGTYTAHQFRAIR